MENKYYNALIDYVKKHLKDYEKRLLKAPYNLKNIGHFVEHPNWRMFNYNLFESDLDNDIVKASRGSILEILEDGTVTVICGPYTKFFDINDPHADIINWASKKLKCEEKIDGQLVKCFKYKGEDFWVTNGGTGLNTPLDYATDTIENYKQLVSVALGGNCGSFEKGYDTSNFKASMRKQGKFACVDFGNEDFHVDADWVKAIPDGWTLMFELTSPQNRIIVKYNEIKIWFHGARDPNGVEHSPEEVKEMFGIPYDIPKRYNLSKKEDVLAALAKFKGEEQEGFVVVDEENWTRVKMKSPSYLALKYVRDNDTPEGIWRLCVDENHDDFPELKEKTDAQVKEINKFNKEFLATMAYASDVWLNDFKKNRKEFALWVNEQVAPNLRPIYFKAIDHDPKEYLKIYWDFLKQKKDGYKEYVEVLKSLEA